MTKKEQKEINRKNRTLVLFNTGTRTHKDKRRETRNNSKKIIKNYLTSGE